MLNPNNQLTVEIQNFVLSEFACKCGCNQTIIDNELILLLQAFRLYLNRRYKRNVRIFITSAYRCETHNANVGGSPVSQHKEGKAVDITTPDITFAELRAGIETFKTFPTILIYPERNFIHVDTRKRAGRNILIKEM